MLELPNPVALVTHELSTSPELRKPKATARSKVQRRVTGITNALAITFAFIVLRSIAEHEGLTAIQPHNPGNPQSPPSQLASEKPHQLSATIRVANPFDSSEVFEFPPGTSKSEAHELMANLLLQRARERRIHPRSS